LGVLVLQAQRSALSLQQLAIQLVVYLNNIVEQDHRAIKQRCSPLFPLPQHIRRSDRFVVAVA
jgi:transposase-like protein